VCFTDFSALRAAEAPLLLLPDLMTVGAADGHPELHPELHDGAGAGVAAAAG